MQSVKNYVAPVLMLRVTLALGYLWEVADRLGFLGAHGQPHVGWGDWAHFTEYTRQTLAFIPAARVPVFAVMATIAEAVFGILLLIGLFTRMAAVGSGVLSFLFALAMAISFGIESPIGYSVFTVSAASFLLAIQPGFKWSIDSLLQKSQQNEKH
ncbi:DoxX family protein [Mucilaginibacter sp.]|jgi:uncharacterized membrane protein YphA (DoxX/SURF4 family)|uniref:DoxX family protein n=1 Tax=Mucilaginibacter sp. TaxID=1882438 RepID=UPI00356870C4